MSKKELPKYFDEQDFQNTCETSNCYDCKYHGFCEEMFSPYIKYVGFVDKKDIVELFKTQ